MFNSNNSTRTGHHPISRTVPKHQAYISSRVPHPFSHIAQDTQPAQLIPQQEHSDFPLRVNKYHFPPLHAIKRLAVKSIPPSSNLLIQKQNIMEKMSKFYEPAGSSKSNKMERIILEKYLQTESNNSTSQNPVKSAKNTFKIRPNKQHKVSNRSRRVVTEIEAVPLGTMGLQSAIDKWRALDSFLNEIPLEIELKRNAHIFKRKRSKLLSGLSEEGLGLEA